MTNRRRAYLICQFGGWSAHGLINLGFASLSLRLRWPMILALIWAETLAGYSSHLLRGWVKRHGWLELPLLRVLPRIFAGSLACGAAVTAVSALTSVVFGFSRDPAWDWINVIPVFFVWSVVIFLWAVIYFGLHYFEGYRDARFEQLRLAVAAKDAELRALLAQVNPHFLFNCLNSLRGLIVEDPSRAQEMVDQIANILRYSLQSGGLQAVPLERELEAIRAYLKLESIRFEERLRFEIDADPASLAIPIPPMLVQMLVENGVKHGISQLTQGGEIRVISRLEPNGLKVQVINSGQLTQASGGTQIGLNNARERLRVIYGAAASLVLRNGGADDVIAEVILPVRSVAV